MYKYSTSLDSFRPMLQSSTSRGDPLSHSLEIFSTRAASSLPPSFGHTRPTILDGSESQGYVYWRHSMCISMPTDYLHRWAVEQHETYVYNVLFDQFFCKLFIFTEQLFWKQETFILSLSWNIQLLFLDDSFQVSIFFTSTFTSTSTSLLCCWLSMHFPWQDPSIIR